jgi:hypothetical protein
VNVQYQIPCLPKKADILAFALILLAGFLNENELIAMGFIVYVYFLLPALIAFVVLWHLDSALVKRFNNPFIIDIIEVFTALLILLVGEGLILYFLFSV